MLVPLPQAFAVDRGSIRGWSGLATVAPRSGDPDRSGRMTPSGATGAAGTSSSGTSSEISPTLAGTTAAASEYDDCLDGPRDLDDTASITDTHAAAREPDRRCIFIKNPANVSADEGDHACVLACSNDAICPEGKVCVDEPCLRPAS
ncbi:hypothetical protein [Nannocystis pusilla]|uniref:hypothetical protein n=1 Tax=Nannocystis pusilla TaxID=889268 RepID=UPI003DA3BF5A